MASDKIFYTDGHEVVVTDSNLIVKKKQYRLLGITRHSLATIKPMRAPGIMLFVLGMLIVAVGAFQLLPPYLFGDLRVFGWTFNENDQVVGLGALIALIGVLQASLVKPKYAVHIATAEGETDVVISKQREYIRQIVDGLNRAFMSRGVKA